MIRVEINEIENRITIFKNWSQSWIFEKINKIGQFLARLIFFLKVKDNKEYHEQLYASKFNLEEMVKSLE